MKDLQSIMYDNSDAGLAARRDADAMAYNAQAQRDSRASDIHDAILDCARELEFDLSECKRVHMHREIIRLTGLLHDMATKAGK